MALHQIYIYAEIVVAHHRLIIVSFTAIALVGKHREAEVVPLINGSCRDDTMVVYVRRTYSPVRPNSGQV